LTDALNWSSRHLGYRFVDERLLEQALTHRSAGAMHNERLEFLGDAVLGMVIARALYERKPQAREGALSRYRARLVRKETLAALARELQLDQHLQMGPGEYRTGGHQRSTVLADALEALFGAVLLDSADLIDAKTALQEWLQARGLPPPEYELVEVLGADHARTFTSQCRVPALGLETRGSGRSRRLAEQAAAGCAMQQVGDDS
jgi:ribonuclease-3